MIISFNRAGNSSSRLPSSGSDLRRNGLYHIRIVQEMRAFSKQVNAAIVDPKFIAIVRKKLMLDQREAAEISGGGVNAFSRSKNGKTKQPLALVKLLKVLDRHPDLLNEVRMA